MRNGISDKIYSIHIYIYIYVCVYIYTHAYISYIYIYILCVCTRVFKFATDGCDHLLRWEWFETGASGHLCHVRQEAQKPLS